jgi:hypothetical protein
MQDDFQAGIIARAGKQAVAHLLISAFVLLASTAAAPAQGVPSETVPYCAELKHITNLAMTRERFASIIGKTREGNFRDTTMPLTGWKNCSFYGQATYTCDSPELSSASEAEKAQTTTAHQIVACLDAWDEAKEQSGPNFIVLHPRLGPASITLNLDETDIGRFVVRLTLFLRRS